MAEFASIEQFLKEKEVDFMVINLPGTAVSVDDVVRLSNGQVREEEIIKTLIVKKKDGAFLGMVLSGRDRINSKIISRFATKDEVLDIAKVEFGAVCPISIGIPVVIDRKVTSLKRINMGSGDHLKGLEMDFDDLLKVLSDYRVEEVSI